MTGIKDKFQWRLKCVTAFSLIIFCAGNFSSAQSNIFNKYGLTIIKDINVLRNEIALDSNLQMVDVHKKIPQLVLDLKYSTTNNFMHKKLYPTIKTTYLRKPAADSLKKIVAELLTLNLGLKIWDAYRPYSVTEKMWEQVKDSRYAADPAKGSGHNRGAAVDLTLIDLTTGKELSMGTGFDNFSDTAHQDFRNLPPDILKNRDLLKAIMIKYGFIPLSTEWWHFYLPNSADYELLDVSFSDLKRLVN
jgi:D-alanyl-D-alanine dipeptidase